MEKIKVAVVDDSALVRQVISEIINQEDDMETVVVAPDPVVARIKFEKNWPDVIITDIEMPKQDGISFLQDIMSEHPTPVIICSSHVGDGGSLSIRAMGAGAVDIIEKPKLGVKDFLNDSVTILTDSIRSASKANMKIVRPLHLGVEPKRNADAMVRLDGKKVNADDAERIVILGASAGGTQAIEAVLRALSPDAPPVAIVQHMPEFFTKAFADRLDSICSVGVKEASDGDILAAGTVLIAPGGRHMMIDRKSGRYMVSVKEGPLVSRHRPSVDVLFRSAAKCSGKNAMGIILTGMGDDGARGMLEMHQAGIFTVAQDEHSCVVFGMPKEAIRLGGVDQILPLREIPSRIMEFKAKGR